ncbi:unnamed protein product [Notodromas monacha]|uniref:MAGUK p55 subfamily member 7 n=1 Tax=Notodromas monacha TaxID=399045 RepID=A0A7R9BR39_9CRUS|nr:unnamed protein product [Notodromas monacha]CAG0919067.1 unnamed protein product [Notodromas monacha]
MTSAMHLQQPDSNLLQLLSSLNKVKGTLSDSDEDFGFLNSLLQSRELQALIQVHNSISKSINGNETDAGTPVSCLSITPVSSNVEDLAYDVLDVLHPLASKYREARELYYILQKPHFQSLFSAHDSITQKDYLPRLPDIPLEVDEDEEAVKIVQLVKSSEQLPGKLAFEPIVGATIKADEKTGQILIARVMHGGAADRSGVIHVGDEVHEVNGIPVHGKTPNEVLKILQESEGTITFKLIPSESKFQTRESKVRVRACFDYDPSDDQHIPCKEAGLPFKKHDILHIVSQDDAYWWQSRHEGDNSMRSGIIPSKALQERRILSENANGHEVSVDEGFLEVPTYEDVARLYPQPRNPRPVVLFGPSGVGCNELKRRLIAVDPDKYRTTVPYTSRPRKPHEVEGQDYFFVSRDQIERQILEGKFLECGEYNGNIYGTSAASVHEIINSGHVAVITPHDQQAMKRLRSAEFKPYIIFIKPPSLQVLRETRNASRMDDGISPIRKFTEEDFTTIVEEGKRIETTYSHWFDQTIVNEDLGEAVKELVQAVHCVETEPLWVPCSWVQ